MLDTTRSIETPEGVVLQFKIAGPIVRALAWVIDLLIRAVIYFIVALFLGYLQSFGTGLFLIIIFLRKDKKIDDKKKTRTYSCHYYGSRFTCCRLC